MARIITGLTRTTELDAINEMLAAIGEAPVTQAEIEDPSLADVTLAVNILKNTAREILSMPWRFNTEWGYEIAPSDTYAWTGTDGSSATLNIFTVPTTLAAFELTASPEQADLDLEARPPEDYSASEGTLIFYDREKNRDGLDEDDFDYLYVDAVWLRDFEDTPEVFRRYVTIKAARRFQARVVGARELDGLTQQDEVLALRNLKRQEGLTESLNIFNNSDMLRVLGAPYRDIYRGSVFEDRDSPGD